MIRNHHPPLAVSVTLEASGVPMGSFSRTPNYLGPDYLVKVFQAFVEEQEAEGVPPQQAAEYEQRDGG
jgi:hypothetical protein